MYINEFIEDLCLEDGVYEFNCYLDDGCEWQISVVVRNPRHVLGPCCDLEITDLTHDVEVPIESQRASYWSKVAELDHWDNWLRSGWEEGEKQ